jgi:hypothetical protein
MRGAEAGIVSASHASDRFATTNNDELLPLLYHLPCFADRPPIPDVLLREAHLLRMVKLLSRGRTASASPLPVPGSLGVLPENVEIGDESFCILLSCRLRLLLASFLLVFSPSLSLFVGHGHNNRFAKPIFLLCFACLLRHVAASRVDCDDPALRSRGRACHGCDRLAFNVDWTKWDGKNSRVLASLPILLRLLGVLVEQARITNAALDRRHVRRIDVLLCQTLPSHLGKPRVVHDIAAASVQVTQTLSQVVCDELGEKVLCVRMDVRRILHAALEDVFVNLKWRAGVPKGRETTEHFEDENTQ